MKNKITQYKTKIRYLVQKGFSWKLLSMSLLFLTAFSFLLSGMQQATSALAKKQPAYDTDASQPAQCQPAYDTDASQPAQYQPAYDTDASQPAQYQPAYGTDAFSVQRHIAENVIRLHVIANSDSDRDQHLKYCVRDAIIGSLQQALKNASAVADARNIIIAQKEKIKETAENVLAENHISCPVTVSLTNRYFPVKQYGDLFFPAGYYQALCVEIGKAEGRNWWCVLFPSLCFVDETTATVPEESKEKLKDHLTEKEYNSLKAPASGAPSSADDPDSASGNPDATSSNPDEASSDPDEAQNAENLEIHSAIWDWFHN